MFEVGGLDAAAASELATRAREIGLPAAVAALPADGPALSALAGTLATRFAHELPEPVRAARAGDVVGPLGHEGLLSLAQVLGRREAVLDGATRAAVQEAVVGEWLARRRAAAAVEWHWA